MVFVTDTHALIHHITGRKRRLGPRARRAFERVERGVDTILVPFTVLEEVMLLSEAGKVRLPLPFRDLLISFAQADNFELGVNDMQLLLEAASFTTLPDPYDRLIVAQARVAGLPLITGDGKFTNPAWFVRFGVKKPSHHGNLLNVFIRHWVSEGSLLWRKQLDLLNSSGRTLNPKL